MIAGIAAVLRPLPEDARRTVTFDRGSEFAACAALDPHLAPASYFCDPHSPWLHPELGRDLPQRLAALDQRLHRLALELAREPTSRLGHTSPGAEQAHLGDPSSLPGEAQ